VGRALRTLGIAVLLGVIIVLLVGLMVSLARPFAIDASAVNSCRDGYARAATAADSAAVDALRPVSSRTTEEAALTCGQWRRAGL
jgi:hypothetical protein